MKISAHTEETGNSILKISGDLVASNIDKLATAFNCLETGRVHVFLDLAEVSFMDSSGLRTCMQLQNNLRAAGGELICYNLEPRIDRLFKVTGADQKIRVINNSSKQQNGAILGTGKKSGFTLTMVPIFEEVDLARQLAEETCREFYFFLMAKEAASDIGDFIIAITEAMNNVVEHSMATQLEVELTVYPHKIIYIIKNDGIRFDPTEGVVMPELDDDDLLEGGFGRAIVNELLDEVRYDFVDGKNVLTLVKTVNFS